MGCAPEDMAFGLDVWKWKLNLTVDTPGTNERGIQRLDPVGGHDHFDISTGIEPVQLIEELQHRPLDLALSARRRVVPSLSYKYYGISIPHEGTHRLVPMASISSMNTIDR